MSQTIKLKRTTALDRVPAALAEGELAVGMNDSPAKLWVGTPGGVKDLLPFVQDAPHDGHLYGREDGEWAPAAPAVPLGEVAVTVEIDWANPLAGTAGAPLPKGLWLISGGGVNALYQPSNPDGQWNQTAFIASDGGFEFLTGGLKAFPVRLMAGDTPLDFEATFIAEVTQGTPVPRGAYLLTSGTGFIGQHVGVVRRADNPARVGAAFFLSDGTATIGGTVSGAQTLAMYRLDFTAHGVPAELAIDWSAVNVSFNQPVAAGLWMMQNIGSNVFHWATQSWTMYAMTVSDGSAVGPPGSSTLRRIAITAKSPSRYVTEAPEDGLRYARQDGDWAALTQYVQRTGDTMTGPLTIDHAMGLQVGGPTFQRIRTVDVLISGTYPTWRYGANVPMTRWQITRYNDSGVEIDTPLSIVRATGNVVINNPIEFGEGSSSNFGITRVNAIGAYIDTPLTIGRLTGEVSVARDPVEPLGVATKQYVDALPFLPLTGGTLTGPVTTRLPSSATAAPIVMDRTQVTNNLTASIISQLNGVDRWRVILGNNTAETGTADAGSDFQIQPAADAGTWLSAAMSITRAGITTFSNAVTSTWGRITSHGGFTVTQVQGSNPALNAGGFVYDTQTDRNVVPLLTGNPNWQPIQQTLVHAVDGVYGGVDWSGVSAGLLNVPLGGVNSNTVAVRNGSTDFTLTPGSTALSSSITSSPHKNEIPRFRNPRWRIVLGDGGHEYGGNVANNFIIQRFSDDGIKLADVMKINRATGEVEFEKDPATALGAATKQYVDALISRISALEARVAALEA